MTRQWVRLLAAEIASMTETHSRFSGDKKVKLESDDGLDLVLSKLIGSEVSESDA